MGRRVREATTTTNGEVPVNSATGCRVPIVQLPLLQFQLSLTLWRQMDRPSHELPCVGRRARHTHHIEVPQQQPATPTKGAALGVQRTGYQVADGGA